MHIEQIWNGDIVFQQFDIQTLAHNKTRHQASNVVTIFRKTKIIIDESLLSLSSLTAKENIHEYNCQHYTNNIR